MTTEYTARTAATLLARANEVIESSRCWAARSKKFRGDAEVKMAIPQWHDLTQEEQQAIAELYIGISSLLTARMTERLKALGLTEQTPGGIRLNEQGRKLFESR